MTHDEYNALKKNIDYHMNRYYNLDAPVISDYEYDQLMIRLKEAEKEHPEWVTPDSPSQKIGGSAKRDPGVKVTHDVPMLSIEDVFRKEDVSEWVDKVHEVHPEAKFSVEIKVDGLSMTVRYRREEDHKLHLYLAESRGDGLIGEDVTVNAEVIPDVKQVIDLPFENLEIRGEVYMTHKDFERYNYEMVEEGRKTAANPRNLAAGTLRQLDAAVTKKRGLRMFIFNVQSGPSEMMDSHTAALDRLQMAGVPVVYHRLCRTSDEVLNAIDEIGEMRGSLPFDIDGAVVKIDHIAWRDDFPAGSKYSSGHIAYKYPPEEAIVTMDQILVDVGRTGKLTFTGVFHDSRTGKPARLCGTSVSRATLHNMDYIRDMKIGIGGQYRLFKSGEIIPKLNGCVAEPPEVFREPERCPVCGERLVHDEDTVDIRCVNPSCPAQLTRTIGYFTSRDCMNIMGLGETLVDALVHRGYLKNYADIYHLKDHREQLIEEGIIGKEKNTDKVLAGIENSKQNSPALLLTGLGIRNCGRTTARAVMRHFRSIDDLASASVEQLTEIPDIGETTARSIYDFFHNENNVKILQELKDAGVNMTMPVRRRRVSSDAAESVPSSSDTSTAIASETSHTESDESHSSDNNTDYSSEMDSSKLQGLTFVITGTLPTLGRREAQDLIEDNGGKASGSVSRKTSYVVAGEAAGSKLQKAQQLGIPVITEQDLLNMIRN